MNDMINEKKMKLFVCSLTGTSKAPTVVMTYLCLFKKIKGFKNLSDVDDLIKSYHPSSSPNVLSIKSVLVENIEFLKQ